MRKLFINKHETLMTIYERENGSRFILESDWIGKTIESAADVAKWADDEHRIFIRYDVDDDGILSNPENVTEEVAKAWLDLHVAGKGADAPTTYPPFVTDYFDEPEAVESVPVTFMNRREQSRSAGLRG